MYSLAVMSSDTELNDRISLLCAKFKNYFTPTFFSTKDDFLGSLKYDLPEMNLLNYSDKNIDHHEIMTTIQADPWLHYGAVIIVHGQAQQQEVRDITADLNVIATISRANFVEYFFRLLKILVRNQQMLFQRDLQRHMLRKISGSLVMDNDPFNVHTYSNLIPHYLYHSGYIDRDLRTQLHVALFEMFMNAVEHGNCNIDYSEKTAWLEDYNDILDLIRKKNQDATIKKRRVHFSYTLTPERSKYTIRDDGQGFDWKTRMATKTDQHSYHGRGIVMTQFYTENLVYNDAGNEVSFEVPHNLASTSVVPAIFHDQEERIFQNGEIVFTEGDKSNYLYYIISGQLDIYRNGVQVSRLNQNDLFLGEMSFLLSDNRSATVRSHGECHLMTVARKDFINSIQAKPHYGLLLSRLLAIRLDRMNKYVAKLQSRSQDLP